MRVDPRVKHDVEARRHVAELFDSGAGCWGASRAFPSPGASRDNGSGYTARSEARCCRICPDSIDAFYAAFGRPSSAAIGLFDSSQIEPHPFQAPKLRQ